MLPFRRVSWPQRLHGTFGLEKATSSLRQKSHMAVAIEQRPANCSLALTEGPHAFSADRVAAATFAPEPEHDYAKDEHWRVRLAAPARLHPPTVLRTPRLQSAARRPHGPAVFTVPDADAAAIRAAYAQGPSCGNRSAGALVPAERRRITMIISAYRNGFKKNASERHDCVGKFLRTTAHVNRGQIEMPGLRADGHIVAVPTYGNINADNQQIDLTSRERGRSWRRSSPAGRSAPPAPDEDDRGALWPRPKSE